MYDCLAPMLQAAAMQMARSLRVRWHRAPSGRWQGPPMTWWLYSLMILQSCLPCLSPGLSRSAKPFTPACRATRHRQCKPFHYVLASLWRHDSAQSPCCLKCSIWVQETQRCALLIKRHALSPFAAPAGLGSTVQCCSLALLHCRALQASHNLALGPTLLRELWPACDQASTCHIGPSLHLKLLWLQ